MFWVTERATGVVYLQCQKCVLITRVPAHVRRREEGGLFAAQPSSLLVPLLSKLEQTRSNCRHNYSDRVSKVEGRKGTEGQDQHTAFIFMGTRAANCCPA